MSAQSRPISQLAAVAQQIDGMLEAGIEQYANLKQTQLQSGASDDYLLGRVVSRLTVQRDDLWRLDAQLSHWVTGELSAAQRAEVQRLTVQMLRLYDVIDSILRLAAELQRAH